MAYVRVPGVLAAIVGTWVDGRPWRPDPVAFRAALPFRWRKAFDRDGAFWHDKRDNAAPAYTVLRDRRGRYLATVYCNPLRESGIGERLSAAARYCEIHTFFQDGRVYLEGFPRRPLR